MASRQRSSESLVRAMYRRLARSWGPQHWWPAETAFEVIAGAILTQNTSWKNVERALASLRDAGALNIAGVRDLPLWQLEQLVRSSGYYRQKAQRLKVFVAFVDEKYGGSLQVMFAAPTNKLRDELLSLKGIGPETADAILLYAGNHEVFVVDAYARRVLERHAVLENRASYDEVRLLVEHALKAERPTTTGASILATAPMAHQPTAISASQRTPKAQVYNEMHGLFVQIGKHYCHRLVAHCEQCPLRSFLP